MAELFHVLELFSHFIDMETKFAKKILDEDYFKIWMRDARRRIKRQQKMFDSPTVVKKYDGNGIA